MRDGTYSYRFSGSSMKSGRHFRIAGVGSLVVADLIVDDGHHRSSVMASSGSDAAVAHAHFLVTGRVEEDAAERNWLATLVFTEQDPPNDRPAQVLEGAFRAVAAGVDRYWLISAGAVTISSGAEFPAHELVDGEIVRA